MRLKSFYFIILLSCCIAVKAHAQNDNCHNNLFNANKSFEIGDFSSVINQLLPCLNKGFSADEKFDAFRLLALSYYYKNNADSSEIYIKKMLQEKPEYIRFPNLGENEEFIKKVRGYEILPMLSIAGYAGFNISYTTLIKKYTPSPSVASYTPGVELLYGGMMTYNILKNVEVVAGVHNMLLTYIHVIDNIAASKQTFNEKLSYICIPVMGRYTFSKYKLRPYAEGGYEVDILTDAFMVLQYSNTLLPPSPNPEFLTGSRKEYHNSTYNGWVLGAGFMYPLGQGNVFINSRYKLSLSPLVPDEKRYRDIGFIFDNHYIDDEFRLDYLSFTLGYQLPLFYSVRKK